MVESVLKGGYEVPDYRDRCSGDEPGRDPRLCGFFPVEGEKKGRSEGGTQPSSGKQDQPEDQFFCGELEDFSESHRGCLKLSMELFDGGGVNMLMGWLPVFN